MRGQDRLSRDLRLDLNGLRQMVKGERAVFEERLHDLRNAVAALCTADTTLRRYGGQFDAAARNELADALSAELTRLRELITPLRSVDWEDISLAETLAPIVAVEGNCGTKFEMSVGDVWVRGDRPGLVQVLQNLLVNARRYAPGSPVRVAAEVRGERVQLRVEDEGPGIDETERSLIFERSARGSKSAGIEGDGLGLFIAARLMADMGGRIWLADRPGRGACFVLDLAIGSPRALASEERPSSLSPVSPIVRAVR